MYSLISAVLLKRVKPKGFEEVAVGNMSIDTLYKDYVQGYLVLSNNSLPGELFLDLTTMRGLSLGLSSYQSTVNQWLVTVGNKLLPHTKVEPTFNIDRVRYADAYQSGFTAEAVHPNSTIEGYPLSSLTDLYLKKNTVDTTITSKRAVYTVNGYLHTHTAFREGVKISDGSRSIQHSKCNHLGVLSFNEIGDIDLVNITTDMIKRSASDISYYEECYLDLGVDLTNKTVLISFAGQLLYSRDAVKVFDAEHGKVMVSLSRINLIDRIQRAVKFLEFPEILLTYENYLSNPLDTEVILSDAFILAALRMSQTFAIIVDRQYLGVDKEPVMYGSVLGRYHSHEYKYLPMLDEYGRFVPYFYQGNSAHPYLYTKHIFSIPHEFTERTFNIRDTAPWRYRPVVAEEVTPLVTRPMHCRWLKLDFINPA